jgi:hypothetical protein
VTIAACDFPGRSSKCHCARRELTVVVDSGHPADETPHSALYTVERLSAELTIL